MWAVWISSIPIFLTKSNTPGYVRCMSTDHAIKYQKKYVIQYIVADVVDLGLKVATASHVNGRSLCERRDGLCRPGVDNFSFTLSPWRLSVASMYMYMGEEIPWYFLRVPHTTHSHTHIPTHTQDLLAWMCHVSPTSSPHPASNRPTNTRTVVYDNTQ